MHQIKLGRFSIPVHGIDTTEIIDEIITMQEGRESPMEEAQPPLTQMTLISETTGTR
jgi:hypothetical protein